MVSPETLRRYPFFGGLTEDQLREIASITEEVKADKGETIFEECGPADKLCLLVEGEVDLFYRAAEEAPAKPPREFLVGEINPGEVFGVSSLIEPYALNATARASKPSQMLVIDAQALRQMMEKDLALANKILSQTTKVLMERLGYLRVQLAAANA